MNNTSGRTIMGLTAVGVIAGIALASLLRGYLVAPSRGLFIVFAAMLAALFVCTGFWPVVPARIMQLLTSCTLGVLFVSVAVGR
jgi:hypothetical protein